MFAPDPTFTSIISNSCDFIKVKDYIFRKDKIMKISKEYDLQTAMAIESKNCFTINVTLQNSDKTIIYYDTEEQRDNDYKDICIDLGIPEEFKEDEK